jgi:hypothetical protein
MIIISTGGAGFNLYLFIGNNYDDEAILSGRLMRPDRCIKDRYSNQMDILAFF